MKGCLLTFKGTASQTSWRQKWGAGAYMKQSDAGLAHKEQVRAGCDGVVSVEKVGAPMGAANRVRWVAFLLLGKDSH